MSFWNTQKLRHACESYQLIEPYDPIAVKRCAYELSVGDEAFIPSTSSENIKLETGKGIAIPPGQFCLLITREVVHVPANAIAFISIRAGIKFKGLVNVSGFHVDPGWKGMLKFAVYNAGSEKIHLDYGERIFMIWYCDGKRSVGITPGDNQYWYQSAAHGEIDVNMTEIGLIVMNCGMIQRTNVSFSERRRLCKYYVEISALCNGKKMGFG